MLTDRQLHNLTEHIIDIAREIEFDLIRSIAKRININDQIGGTAHWQLQQLNEMGALHQENLKIISRLSGKTTDEVKKLIEKASIQGVDMEALDKVFEKGLIPINPRAINLIPTVGAFQDELNRELRMILTSAITESNVTYQRLIDKVSLEVTGGFKSYDQAIQDGLNDLAEKGIATTRYEGINKNGDPYIIEYPLEASVRRSVMTAVNQVANESNREVIDTLNPPQIAVSAHAGARNKGTGYENHEKWQGKIYDNDGEFEMKTGYGSLDNLGLGGYNCRHVHWAYWEGISVKPEPVEVDPHLYDLVQRQRLLERRVRNSRKRVELAKYTEREEYILKEKRLLNRRLQNLKDHCKQNNLKRDYTRERIAKNYKPL